MENSHNIKRIFVPLQEDQIYKLKAGDLVSINGYIYTARDHAHKLFSELIKSKEKLPIELNGQILFYAGITPTKTGNICGSIGPTSSYRMDQYTPVLMECGLKGMIGKGPRSIEVIDSMIKNKAVYFIVIGGTAALISDSIKECEKLNLKELNSETIYRLNVSNFLAIVAIDSYGNNLYDTEPPKYKKYVNRINNIQYS